MARIETAKKKATNPKNRNVQSSSKSEVKGKKTPVPASPNVKGKDFGKSKSKGKAPERAAAGNGLKEAIIALGGDEEDLELLKDIDSDVDLSAPSNSKKDASLSKDLSKLMKGLDFSKVRPRDARDSEEEEDGDSEDDKDDEDSSEIGKTNDGGKETSPSKGVKDSKQQSGKKEEKKSDIVIPKVGPNSRLLLEPSSQWYSTLPALSSSSKGPGPPSPQTLSTLQTRGASLHATELSTYETATSANKLTASSSDVAFLQRILTSGTLSDRLSALTLMAQSSPVHNTRALETLRGMGQKKGRDESLKALRSIVDWWTGGGAPDRKLKYFVDQPITHPGVTDKHILLWYFEDWLKKYFYSVLQILETLSLDQLPYVRMQAMSLIFTLLRDKPEQEQNLLRLLVNKLGDSERPVASRASYHLLQILQTHPSMKGVIVREVAALILRPLHGGASAPAASTTTTGATHLKFGDDSKPKPKPQVKDNKEKKDLQQEHAKYYGTITLNQIMLTPTESDRAVAIQLINLYFELFKEILGQAAKPDGNIAGDDAKNDVDHTRLGKEKRKKQEQRKGKGKEKEKEEHEAGFTEVEDSNSKLISAVLTGVNRALPFAKLGLENVEFSKHIDTLFLISHKSTFNISLQALRLIMQICQSLSASPSESSSYAGLSTSIADRYYRTLYASLHDTRLNTSSKQAMYLNLLLKSLKMDTNIERVKAFVRRFVQHLAGGGSGAVEFIAGGLFLLGEVFKTTPGLRDMLDPNRSKKKSSKPTAVTPDAEGDYDPRKRDPKFAHASASPLWELCPLLNHFHPTVQLHAMQLIQGKDLTANADLSLNTLSHFLDRFIYKNPKKPKPKGASAMQPSAAAPDGTSIKLVKGNQSTGEAIVNNESFWSKDISGVPVDQAFFHKFFSKKHEKEKAKADKAAKRKGAADESDEEEEQEEGEQEGGHEVKGDEDLDASDEEFSDEEEAEIWKAMKATNPDLVGGDDDISPDDDSSGGSEGMSDEDGDVESDDAAPEEQDDDDDDEDLSLAEGSDADDLIDLDDDIPEGLVEYPGSESGEGDGEGGEWSGFGGGDAGTKRKRGRKQDDGKKKKKLRSLPTFASYEDYAKMIEEGPEDDI